MSTARWKLEKGRCASIRDGFHRWAMALNIRNADGSRPYIGPKSFVFEPISRYDSQNKTRHNFRVIYSILRESDM